MLDYIIRICFRRSSFEEYGDALNVTITGGTSKSKNIILSAYKWEPKMVGYYYNYIK